MALTDGEAGGIPATMLVGPTNTMPYHSNDGFGDGNGWWIVLLIIIFAMGGWNNNGYGNGQPIIVNDGNGGSVQRGFDQASVMSGISGIQNDVAGLSTQLCNSTAAVQQSLCSGFGGVNATINSGFANAETAANSRQMANMNQAFASQTAMAQGFNNLQSQFANCCCENRLSSADLKYTIATENCADRAALSDGIKDLLVNQTANTQRILDQLCADKIEQKNDTIAQLRSELLYARGQASQDVQTAQLIADNTRQTAALEQYLNPVPVPAYIVANPNCCTNSCGCGM